MATFILETLVLRGVVVLCDETAVVVRLGASVKANPHAPGVSNSMRHPRPGYRRPDVPVQDPDVADAMSGVVPGAGRSRRSSGLAQGSRRPSWRTLQGRQGGGGTAPAAATKRPAITAGFAAPATEANATRTPPAARRGLI